MHHLAQALEQAPHLVRSHHAPQPHAAEALQHHLLVPADSLAQGVVQVSLHPQPEEVDPQHQRR